MGLHVDVVVERLRHSLDVAECEDVHQFPVLVDDVRHRFPKVDRPTIIVNWRDSISQRSHTTSLPLNWHRARWKAVSALANP